mmetsp:Transcript_27937/g.65329  ORF Transcript_27937/g.65329 Transcript_27937/m.65329 type:complete len:93 (-) Transcript_27937:268-546(-)
MDSEVCLFSHLVGVSFSSNNDKSTVKRSHIVVATYTIYLTCFHGAWHQKRTLAAELVSGPIFCMARPPRENTKYKGNLIFPWSLHSRDSIVN